MPLDLSSYISVKYTNGESKFYCLSRGDIGNSFRGDANIMEISLGKGIRRIPCGAFVNCTSLTTVRLSSSLKIIERNSFLGCSSLQQVEADEPINEVDCWLDPRRVSKFSMSNPSPEELADALQNGYALDLYYNGEYSVHYWD